MSSHKDLIEVNVNVKMPVIALQTIVENAKKIVGPDKKKGYYRIDTADKVSEMISKFLLENNFEKFVQNIDNFK